MSEPDSTTTQSLPFSIDEKSFSIWLAKIEKENQLELLQILAETLTQLKKTTIPADIRSIFLEKMAVLVFQVSAQLKKTYIESYFPFSESNGSKIKLSMSCAFELAENYALVCKDPCFKLKAIFLQEQKAVILLHSIQAMASVLLHKAIVYQKPAKGFWGLCYLLYLFAKQNEVLELVTQQGQASFIQIFKQLLIFELSNTQQFNTEEIYTIFNLLNGLTEQVKLLPNVPEKMLQRVSCINLRLDAPPAVAKEAEDTKSAYVLYIQSLNLVKQLFDLSANKKNMPYKDKVLILRFIKTLSMNQNRKNERELADNELLAELGFDKLIEFLLHKESLLKMRGTISVDVNSLSVDTPLGKRARLDTFEFRNELDAGLSLVSCAADADDNVIEYIDNSDIWSKKDQKVSVKEPEEAGNNDSNAILIDQSKLGFCIRLQEKAGVTKVGELIHLFISSISIVTVVRRIIADDHKGVIVGVEVLGYDPEVLHIMDIDNKGARTSCVLVNLEGEESIVIKANEFHNEEHLYVDRNEKILCYKIEKILSSSTSIIKHLQISLS